MTAFVDTSALYALLDRDQDEHGDAAKAWRELVGESVPLLTTNYVLLETTALVQRRLGMKALRAFHDELVPVLEIQWVEEELHRTALAALLAGERRGVSLVDHTSFEVMRRGQIRRAFALDRDFARQGFDMLPG